MSEVSGWACSACGGANPAGAGRCSACGRAKSRRLWLAVAGAVLALSAGAAFLGTASGKVTVTALSWERTVEVQRRIVEAGGAWEDEVPKDAKVVSREKRFHHNERTQTGTKRVKNPGQPEVVMPTWQEEAVYRDYCRFERERWETVRTERLAGEGPSPRWPELHLAAGEREGARAEVLKAKVTDGSGASLELTPAAEQFGRLEAGHRYAAVRENGQLARLEP